MIKIEVDGVVYEHDDGRLMLSEAKALQDLWGLAFDDLTAALNNGTAGLTELAATVWLVKARALAAEKGLKFSEAAAELPLDDFDFDIGSMRLEGVAPAPNPTAAGTRTKGTRTTPATSARKRKSGS